MSTAASKPKLMNWILFAYLTVFSWGVYGVLLHIGRSGMPAGAGAPCVTGRGWCPGPAGGDGGGAGRRYRRWARPGVGGAGAVGCGNVSTVPAWMMPGSEPMARRLAAYRAGQPPRTANSAAMPDKVSPAATV